MDKEQVIEFIKSQLVSGSISKDDLRNLTTLNSVPAGPAPAPAPVMESPVVKESAPRNLTHVFYGIGAIIAIAGVGILIGQNWTEIGFGGRVLVTVGISLITYILGLMFRNPDNKMLSQVMFTISAVLAPMGSYVLLAEGSPDFTWSAQSATGISLAVIFGVALLISKRNILMLITIGFVTWAYYALVMKMFGYSSIYNGDLLKWASLLLGASYLCLTYALRILWRSLDERDDKEKQAIQNVLYGFGTLFILGAGISIGGAFDLIMILFIFGAFYGSVYVRSRSMLTIGALFLIAHIIKMTSKYFVDSVGWPVALIAVGFFVIAVGYFTFYLNRRFIAAR